MELVWGASPPLILFDNQLLMQTSSLKTHSSSHLHTAVRQKVRALKYHRKDSLSYQEPRKKSKYRKGTPQRTSKKFILLPFSPNLEITSVWLMFLTLIFFCSFPTVSLCLCSGEWKTTLLFTEERAGTEVPVPSGVFRLRGNGKITSVWHFPFG